MGLTVVSLGYAGLTSVACLADASNTVFAVYCNLEKNALLNKGIAPFREPWIDNMVFKNLRASEI